MVIDGRAKSHRAARIPMVPTLIRAWAISAIFIACRGICAVQTHNDLRRHWTDPTLLNPLTVIPRKVTRQGHFISHNLTEYHATFLPDGRTSEATSTVHYIIPLSSDGELEDQQIHLQLEPSKRLTRSSTLVESITDVEGERMKRSDLNGLRADRRCQFVGKVKGDDESKVALSACDGLSGYIRTKRGYYLIHPVTKSKRITNATHAWGTPQQHHMYPYERESLREDEQEDLFSMMADKDGRWNREIINASVTQLPPEDMDEMYIETMVVLDNSMMRYHKDVDLENYILTVFNMAHSLFHDVSLGRNINLAIVRLVRLEHEDYDLNLALNKNPQKTLEHFVSWQQKINPKDDAHPNHHDMAILITRLDVCDNMKTCGWLGAARVGGVCDPNHQVALCQDVGLRLGFVIAHQIGHALGLPHDTSEECGCKDRAIGGAYTVMSPRISSRTAFWSNCSREALRNFLNSGFGGCLYDEPTEHSFELTDILPGVMYDADFQCRTLLGPTASQCMTGMDCNNLICYIEDKGCVETHIAVAPGTKCAEKKWCVKGKCMFVGERPGAVHGGWGDWGEWTACTRTCGSGVSSQTRHCDNPMTSGGGRYCIGEHTKYKICSTDPCDTKEPSFRDVQCAEFNSWLYPEDGKIHQWKNYPIHDENPCLLFCVNDEGTVASLRPRVIDGTKCQYGMRDICINGLCKEIPCDLDLDSNAVEDRCGVCQGDGTSCRIIEGRKHFSCTEYVVSRRFTEIPKGAINIKIEETMPSESRIQIRDMEGNILFCGGDDLGLFTVPGSKAWIGIIRAEQEAISIPGPIDENLTIWIDLMQNVTVKYSYGMPVPMGHRRRTYFAWDYVKWTRCSAECGVGTQKAEPVCVESRSGFVDGKFCAHIAKPRELIRACEIAPCSPRWFMGDWLPCDCHHNKQVRIVLCVMPTGEGEGEMNAIDDANCVPPKPKLKNKCKCRSERQVSRQITVPTRALMPWPYTNGPHVMYMNLEPDSNIGNYDKTSQLSTNQTTIDANISTIINQTSFQNASAPFNVTKANLTNLLKNESSVNIDALCKNITKQFDLRTRKNSTVIDFDNTTLVNLIVHADFMDSEFPEELLHTKRQNATWYMLSGKKAMFFISEMQKNYGDENKTQV